MLQRVLPALLASALAGGALAQQPERPGARPAAVRDSTAADTTRAPAPPDSIYQRLLKLEGFQPVEYLGERALFRNDDRLLHLWGDAQVVRDGQTLTADSIVYNERTRIATARGNPKVAGTQALEGEVLVYDMERRVARIQGGRTQVAQGNTWYVRGDNVVAEQETDRVYAENSRLTTDDREEPQYHFRVDRSKIIRNRLLVGRPAKLYFRNVPVFWLPFIVQDMEKGRRSGILVPRFGVNDIVRNSPGYRRQISNIGYYWAVNEYMGSQFALDWRSGSYTAVQGSLDYNWRREFLSGNMTAKRYFLDDGGSENSYAATSSWRPDERTSLQGSGRYASSNRFIRRNSIDPYEPARELYSSVSGNRRFDWGDVTLGAERRQSIGTEEISTTFPSFGITPRTLTLFRSGSPETAQWFNDVALTFSASGQFGSRSLPIFRTGTGSTSPVSDEATRRTLGTGSASLSQSLSMGNLGLSSSLALNRQTQRDRVQIEGLSRDFEADLLSWNSSLDYRVGLIGTTYLAPRVSVSREFKRDTLTVAEGFEPGHFVGNVPRVAVGASLNNDLFGFFPGIGPFERIRHHIRSNVEYSFAPGIQIDTLNNPTDRMRSRVFSQSFAEAQNRITLSLDHTFEGKLKRVDPQPRPGAAGTGSDTAAVDTAAAARTEPPQDAQKVTILALNTNAFQYDIVRRALLTDEISGTVRSDFLQGLNLSFAVDLFEDASRDELLQNRFAHGGFAPVLTSLGTSFALGQNSGLFRRLGLGGSDRQESLAPVSTLVPDSAGIQPEAPGQPTATANPQPTSRRAPWSMQLNYNFSNGRSQPLTDPTAGYFSRGLREQSVQASLQYTPTPNWALSWNTTYSIQSGEFNGHSLNLVRDLYRWQANFGFYRTVVGNSSFQFAVHLKDLPDLKFDYNERNIGETRR